MPLKAGLLHCVLAVASVYTGVAVRGVSAFAAQARPASIKLSSLALRVNPTEVLMRCAVWLKASEPSPCDFCQRNFYSHVSVHLTAKATFVPQFHQLSWADSVFLRHFGDCYFLLFACPFVQFVAGSASLFKRKFSWSASSSVFAIVVNYLPGLGRRRGLELFKKFIQQAKRMLQIPGGWFGEG